MRVHVLDCYHNHHQFGDTRLRPRYTRVLSAPFGIAHRYAYTLTHTHPTPPHTTPRHTHTHIEGAVINAVAVDEQLVAFPRCSYTLSSTKNLLATVCWDLYEWRYCATVRGISLPVAETMAGEKSG